eukprot:s749_g10.t1
MAAPYTSECPFRFAVVGDSWVSEVDVLPDGRRQPKALSAKALKDVLQQRMGHVDFTVAGFPGLTTWAMHDICTSCTLRDAATLSARCYSVGRYPAASQCELEGLPDPYREVLRKKMNRKLKRDGEVIDLDSLFGRYDPALWRDGYHLNDMGCDHFGKLLGHYLVRRFGQFPTAHINGKDPKSGVPGSQDVFIFYCDSRWGRKWRGWYIGPDVHLRRSSWAFHPGPSLGIDGWWTNGRGLPRWASTRVRVTRKRRQVTRMIRRSDEIR